jgi:hypothetical protein
MNAPPLKGSLPVDLAAWLSTGRELFRAAFPGPDAPLRILLSDAASTGRVMSFVLPAAIAGTDPDVGQVLALTPRERAVLEAVRDGPLRGGDIAELLSGRRLVQRRRGKWPGWWRTFLSRMAHRRRLLSSPIGGKGYAITSLGLRSLLTPETLLPPN